MLNIFSLNNVRDQKELNRYEIYRKVLKKCHYRINTVSSKGDSFCFYVIPEYIYGIPKYDTLYCASYILKKLKNNGFKVLYTYPNLIFISWDHVPSEIINPKIKDIDVKTLAVDKQIEEKPTKFRYIEDYKSSNNFLKKIN